MTENYIANLIEDLEDMAALYLTSYYKENLESRSAADDHSLYLLEVLGKIEPDDVGFKWTKNSWWHPENKKSESEFEIKQLPQGITEQELVYAVIQIAKKYLSFSPNLFNHNYPNLFTHNYMSAAEATLKTLQKLGYMTTEDKITYSLTNKPCFTLQDKIHKIVEICRYKGSLKTSKFPDITDVLGEQFYYLELCSKPLSPGLVVCKACLMTQREKGYACFVDAEAESNISVEDAVDKLLKCPELNLLEIRNKFGLSTQTIQMSSSNEFVLTTQTIQVPFSTLTLEHTTKTT
jgi:hypothetical protein